MKRKNNWVTQNHHGLDYTDRDVVQEIVYKSLRAILKRVQKINISGANKNGKF